MPPTQLSLRALEEYVFLNAAFTLVSQTALQRLFNATAGGALTVEAGTSYFFECSFDLTAMSITSGNFGFGFLGTAVMNSLKYNSTAQKTSAIGTPSTSQSTVVSVATAVGIVSASVSAAGNAIISGIIRVNTGGTLIPAVSLGIAAPAVVGINSYFRAVPIGVNTQTNFGPWT